MCSNLSFRSMKMIVISGHSVPVIGLLSVAVLPRWVVQLQEAEEFQKYNL